MQRTLQEIAEFTGGRVVGDASLQLAGIASIASAGARDLVFVEDEKNLRSALQSQAGAIIAGEFAGEKNSKPLLISPQPRMAFAKAAQLLCEQPDAEPGIHPSAIVPRSVRLGKEVTVEARVVLGEGVALGNDTRIRSGCVLGRNVTIGDGCDLYPNVTVYPGARLGNRVIVHSGAVLGSDGFGYVRDTATGRYHKFPQVGGLEIEDDVEIGANTTIDRGALDVTRICRGSKIDNLVHIGHNCQIGEDVVIAAQAGFSGSIVVGNKVIMGGQAGIGEHARIEEGVMLGGQAGVLPHKVLRNAGTPLWGTPARPLREYLKELAVLARLAKRG